MALHLCREDLVPFLRRHTWGSLECDLNSSQGVIAIITLKSKALVELNFELMIPFKVAGRSLDAGQGTGWGIYFNREYLRAFRTMAIS